MEQQPYNKQDWRNLYYITAALIRDSQSNLFSTKKEIILRNRVSTLKKLLMKTCENKVTRQDMPMDTISYILSDVVERLSTTFNRIDDNFYWLCTANMPMLFIQAELTKAADQAFLLDLS